MPDFQLSTIPESALTISGGEQLSGITQGDGSHLVGETITINSSSWDFVTVTDNDSFFADNDGNQELTNAITYNGVSYDAGDRVEAEYQLTLEDPDGNTYTVMGFNIVGPGGRPFGSVEGLVFLNDFPPVGVPLTVVSAAEGPNNSATPYADYFTPPCFVAGTLIGTPSGPKPVETLKAGDLVETLDNGPLPLAWVGSVHLSPSDLTREPNIRPVRFPNGLEVSPQHRVLVSGWGAQLYCGQGSVLVAAKHFVGSGQAKVTAPADFPQGVTYCHIMFDTHQIVVSGGMTTESFCPGPETMKAMPETAREFERLFPEFQDGKAYEACRYHCGAREAHLVCESLLTT